MYLVINLSTTIITFKTFHVNEKNGLFGYDNTAGINEFVLDSDTRYNLLISYCTTNNNLINWGLNNHTFLPNLTYSNHSVINQIVYLILK